MARLVRILGQVKDTLGRTKGGRVITFLADKVTTDKAGVIYDVTREEVLIDSHGNFEVSLYAPDEPKPYRVELPSGAWLTFSLHDDGNSYKNLSDLIK